MKTSSLVTLAVPAAPTQMRVGTAGVHHATSSSPHRCFEAALDALTPKSLLNGKSSSVPAPISAAVVGGSSAAVQPKAVHSGDQKCARAVEEPSALPVAASTTQTPVAAHRGQEMPEKRALPARRDQPAQTESLSTEVPPTSAIVAMMVPPPAPAPRLAGPVSPPPREALPAAKPLIVASEARSVSHEAPIGHSQQGKEPLPAKTPNATEKAAASPGDLPRQLSFSGHAMLPHEMHPAQSQALPSSISDQRGSIPQAANLSQTASAPPLGSHARLADTPPAEPSSDRTTVSAAVPLQIDPVATPAAPVAPVAAPRAALGASNVERRQTAADQVAPELISLASHADGSNEMTVSLHPRDLGEVHIHVARAADGSTTVTVAASEPQTLQELSQNAHHLHAALDAAHVPSDARTMSFVATMAIAPDLQVQNGPSASPFQGGNTANGQQQAWRRDQNGQPSSPGRDESDASDSATPVAETRHWRLSGLNITA